jgi:large subunit ribosomal protein L32
MGSVIVLICARHIQGMACILFFFSYTSSHMVIRMRHTKAHTKNRRSHHALTALPLMQCADCAAWKKRHHVCTGCGKYRGRVVLDFAKKKLKALQKAS